MTRRFSIRRSGISQISAAITKTAWPLHEERIRSDISRFSGSHSYKKAFEEKGRRVAANRRDDNRIGARGEGSKAPELTTFETGGGAKNRGPLDSEAPGRAAVTQVDTSRASSAPSRGFSLNFRYIGQEAEPRRISAMMMRNVVSLIVQTGAGRLLRWSRLAAARRFLHSASPVTLVTCACLVSTSISSALRLMALSGSMSPRFSSLANERSSSELTWGSSS